MPLILGSPHIVYSHAVIPTHPMLEDSEPCAFLYPRAENDLFASQHRVVGDRLWVLGFRFQNLGFRGLGFRASGLQVSEFRV